MPPGDTPATVNRLPASSALREIELDSLARWARDLSGLDAGLICLQAPGEHMVRWGVCGWPADAAPPQELVLNWAATLPPAPSSPARTRAPRQMRQCVQAPLRGADGGVIGLVLAAGFCAPSADPLAAPIIERLARKLSADDLLAAAHRPLTVVEEQRAANQLEARLRSAMRALQMGSWMYDVAARQLHLSADAATILGVAQQLPRNLDELLHAFTPDSAKALRRAFVNGLRDGRPIDTEVQFEAAGPRRWMRFIGEASRGAAGHVEEIHGAVQDVSTRRQAQEDTVRLAMRLTTTLASMTEAFVTLDPQHRFMYVNRESEQLLGHTTAQLLGKPVHDWLVGQTPMLMQNELDGALKRNVRTEFEDYYAALGKWLEVRAYPYAEGLAVYFRDVTERRQAQEQLMLLQTGIARLNDIVTIVESVNGAADQARIAFVNDAFERQTGFSRDEVVGRTSAMLGHGAGPESLSTLITHLALPDGFTRRRRELLLQRRDGSTYWMELDVVAVRAADGQITHWVAVGRDVTERKQADDKIHRLAFFDPLTGLPNRQLLIERLEVALADSGRTGQAGALMFIDLDHFKVLNDTLGHSRGDLLLKRVAERLRRSVRKADTVARIGGDEFVVMLQSLGAGQEQSAAKMRKVAAKVLARLSEPFDLDGYQHYCTVSIGVAGFGAQHAGVSELLKQADLAMYQAKNMGRDTIAFFDPAMQATISASAALGADLRAALQIGHQFSLHYQPLFDQQRRMTGVEALLRWRHPVRGAVEPADFIPIAEDSGLILPLGAWVLERACAQLAAWAKRPETASLSISVNVSVRQFRHPEFVDQVIAALGRHHVAPRLLKLELTESLMADHMEITLEKMGTLKQLGVTLSLDDFGTGYSSLAYLKRLPLDQLKIDRGFVADVLTDPSDAAIARAIIELAHSQGLSVIAEGVETREQLRFLIDRGCDLFQGFMLAQPMPLDALEDFIRTHRPDKDPLAYVI